MTRQEAVNHIQMSGGLMVSLEFVKRSTGELRQMVCRTGVYSHLRGGEKAYDSESKGLLTVFDMHKNGYRSIPVEGLTRIRVSGEWEEVT